MSSRFERTLPVSPDLDQQKKLAKELLAAFQAGDAEARTRIRERLPDKDSITLADAQFTLAREYGFENWTALRDHIESRSGMEPSLREAVHHAIQARDAKAMRRLLQSHAELRAAINEPLFAFDSPLLVHVAGSANVEFIDVLLEFGADPDARSTWWAGGFHALYSAKGAVADRLIEAGARPDASAAAHLDRPDLLGAMIERDPACVHERSGDGQTPLHFAASRRIVDMLLDAGADPDARDVDHRSTPAQWMLDRKRGAGRYELARYLVERGATPDIFLAAALGLADRARDMLRENPSLLDLRSTKGEYDEKKPSSFHIYLWTIGANLSPLQVALQFEQLETHDVMAAFASRRQRLLAALAAGDADAVDAVLGIAPDALSLLGDEDRSLLPDAAWAANARAVELLLRLGFDIRATTQGGATALHCAAWQGSVECVKLVLAVPGANELFTVHDSEFNGTPLGWCFHGSRYGPERDHATVARLMLDAGARLDANDFSGASDTVRAVVEDWERRQRSSIT